MKFRIPLFSGIASLMILSVTSPLLLADPIYTWSGAAMGGQWNESSNWTVAGDPEGDICPVPAGKGEAVLPSTATDRNILMSGFEVQSRNGENHKNWLRRISIEQDGNGVNQLTLLSPLRVGNSVTLQAGAGGEVRLILSNSELPPSVGASSRLGVPALRFEVGWGNRNEPSRVIVGAGGILEFSGTVYDEGNNAVQINRGDVALQGGQLLLHRGVPKGTSRSVAYSINDSLVMDSGLIDFDAQPISDDKGVDDVRLFVGGDFLMQGGRLQNKGAAAKQLWVNGSSIKISKDAVIDRGIVITLGGVNDQGLESGVALDGICVRPKEGASKKMVTVKATGENIGSISFSQSQADTPATLRLGSNLSLRSDAELPRATVIAPPDGATVIYEIDTAGHTLDLRANPAAWVPNRPNNRVSAEWRITGGGAIYCNGFDFTATGVIVTVAPGTKLFDGNGQRWDTADQ